MNTLIIKTECCVTIIGAPYLGQQTFSHIYKYSYNKNGRLPTHSVHIQLSNNHVIQLQNSSP